MADDSDFEAEELCCACGGGTTAEADVCFNTNFGETDGDGFDCSWYDANPQDCGGFDTDDFEAEVMCCSCGGGDGDYFDPVNTKVTSMADIIQKADNPGDIVGAIWHNPWVLIVWFDMPF